jgi:hypothetical protein
LCAIEFLFVIEEGTTDLPEEKWQHCSNEEVGLYNYLFLRFSANSMFSPKCEPLCILRDLPFDSGNFPAIRTKFSGSMHGMCLFYLFDLLLDNKIRYYISLIGISMLSKQHLNSDR